MKYGELNGLIEALKALRTQPQSFSVARKLKDVCDTVNEEAKWYTEQMQNIVDTCAKKDSDGNLVLTEDGNGVQIDDVKEFNRLSGELMKTETGDIPHVSESFLESFTVSAEQLDYLMIICEVEKNE